MKKTKTKERRKVIKFPGQSKMNCFCKIIIQLQFIYTITNCNLHYLHIAKANREVTTRKK